MTQTDKLLAFLRLNPGASSLEITMACGIVNVTGRVSDLRASGTPVDCRKRTDGRDGYWLGEGEARPGYARFTAEDTPRNIERKVATAFAPVDAALEAWQRVFGGDS
jgi:hypothetical protein